jgi:hypothetical protein
MVSVTIMYVLKAYLASLKKECIDSGYAQLRKPKNLIKSIY